MPTIYGEETTVKKDAQTRVWTREALRERVAATIPAGVEVVDQLLELSLAKGATLAFGRALLPAVSVHFDSVGGRLLSLGLYEWPKGNFKLAFFFEYMIGKVAPNQLERMARRLREIPQLAPALAGLEAAGFKKRPSLPLTQIVTSGGLWHDLEEAIEDLTRPLSDDHDPAAV